jgi:hypothetical protein
MNMTKFAAALALSGFLGLSAASHAETITYEFTADPGDDTVFNGSTITIDGTGANGVSTFTFIGFGDEPGSVLTAVDGDGGGPFWDDNINSYGLAGWSGQYMSLFYLSMEWIPTGNSMYEEIFWDGDSAFAYGTWSTVPDACGTFPLLLAALAALAAVRHCHRPPVLMPTRR